MSYLSCVTERYQVSGCMCILRLGSGCASATMKPIYTYGFTHVLHSPKSYAIPILLILPILWIFFLLEIVFYLLWSNSHFKSCCLSNISSRMKKKAVCELFVNSISVDPYEILKIL